MLYTNIWIQFFFTITCFSHFSYNWRPFIHRNFTFIELIGCCLFVCIWYVGDFLCFLFSKKLDGKFLKPGLRRTSKNHWHFLALEHVQYNVFNSLIKRFGICQSSLITLSRCWCVKELPLINHTPFHQWPIFSIPSIFNLLPNTSCFQMCFVPSNKIVLPIFRFPFH